MEFALPATSVDLDPVQYVLLAAAELVRLELVEGDLVTFQFIRALKAHPKILEMGPAEAFKWVARLPEQARFPLNELAVDMETEDGEVAFHDMWERVRCPLGADPVHVASRYLDEPLLRMPKKRAGRYPQFLTLSALLQIQMRRRPILLPVRTVAPAMRCELNSVSAWTRWAKEDGVLLKVKEHSFRSGGGGDAAEYVFALPYWHFEIVNALAARIGVKVMDDDLAWIESEFRRSRAG